jgi:hypothetical protein
MAFLVLLEALSPVERAVFMLREVSGYGYPDMARILGASLRLAWVNGQPGAVLYDAGGRVVSVLELDVAGGVV